MDRVTITQGDDTNALEEKIIISLDTELDLNGFSACFQLGNFQQFFSDIRTKELQIIIPGTETALLPAGPLYGALKIFDAAGRQKTLADNICFYVKRKAVDHVQ
jgi:hypothetical protein